MKKRVLLTSVVTIILCLCLIAGSTYALFTSSTSASMVVQSATVSVSAAVENLKVYSLTDDKDKKDDAGEWIFEACQVQNNKGSFINGGTVILAGNSLALDRMSPGDKVTFTITVTNGSNIATQCRVITSKDIKLANGQQAPDGLIVTYVPSANMKVDQGWFVMDGTTGTITVTVELPVTHGNAYQNMHADLSVLIEAVQANGVDERGKVATDP